MEGLREPLYVKVHDCKCSQSALFQSLNWLLIVSDCVMCFNLMECVLTNGIVKNLSNVCFTVSTVCRVKWHALLLDVFFHLQVFDYDFGLQDDFMGSAYLYLESLEHQRSSDVLWLIWNTISSVVISINLLWHCCPLVFYIYIILYIMYIIYIIYYIYIYYIYICTNTQMLL